jgi:putative spermidine/putrescine transport system permease protein
MKTDRLSRLCGLLLAGHCFLVLGFLLIPVLMVIPMSFSETRYLKFPPSGFTFHWYSEFFTSTTWIASTTLSLGVAVCSSLLATALGTLAALALRRRSLGARLMVGAFLGPQIVPVIILALGVMLLYSRLHMYGSLPGIVAVHALLALPFVVTSVVGALRQRGDTITQAARVLGATPARAFWHVTLPSIKASVISSAIFSFFISFDELVVALFVMGRNETLPMRIWASVRDDLTPIIAAAATLLIVATVMALLVSEMLARSASPTDSPRG